MSEKMEAVATSEAPAALGAYSQAVKANGFVFVSGQLGIDPATGELAGETAGEQAAQALKNIKHILDTAGTGIEHVCPRHHLPEERRGLQGSGRTLR